MSSLTSHPWAVFIVFFVGLIAIVEIGLRLRLASSGIDEDRQSLIQSARDGLTVLLSFLLGFALPMTLPHYEQRRELVIEEANAIGTVDQRAQMLPQPFQGRIRDLLRQYVDARIAFASERDTQGVLASTARARQLQTQMWQQNVAMLGQYPNLAIAPIFSQSLGTLGDLSEERLAAYERRTPSTIWFVLALISVLTCFVVGYSMRRRLFLAMFVLPLTVAIVLSLVSELDNPRTGFIRIAQESMHRLQQDLERESKT
jgi:hypothetical protein